MNTAGKWATIAAFWNTLMVSFVTVTSAMDPVYTLPTFLQNLDFLTMDEPTMLIWTEAYYAYQTINYFLPTITNEQLIT